MKYRNLRINKNFVKNTLLSVGITSSLVLGTLEGIPMFLNGKDDLDYNNLNYIEMKNDSFADEFNEIYYSSEELQEQWGDIYPELITFIEEYGAYFDQEKILNKLANVQFIITPRSEDKVLAMTDNDKNQISYNERLSSKKRDQIKEVKLHEAFHYLFQDGFFKSDYNVSHIGLSLDEGNANLLTEESGVNVKTTLYEKYSTYVKVLCEIIGPEEYLDAAGSHDWLKLLDYLDDYCTRDEAIELIKNIDKACNYYDSHGSQYDIKVWETIEEMYEKKNGETIEASNDIVMKTYHNKYSGKYYEIKEAKGPTQTRVNKNYYLDNDDPATIDFVRNGKRYGTAILNDKNEIVSGEVLENYYYDDDNNIVDKDGNPIDDNVISLGNNKTK